jgi:hypothetical protein
MKPMDCQDIKNTFFQGNSSPLYTEASLFVKGKNPEKWIIGILEYWVTISPRRHSTIPTFHYSSCAAMSLDNKTP